MDQFEVQILRTFLAGSILNTFHLTVPTPGGRTPEASQTLPVSIAIGTQLTKPADPSFQTLVPLTLLGQRLSKKFFIVFDGIQEVLNTTLVYKMPDLSRRNVQRRDNRSPVQGRVWPNGYTGWPLPLKDSILISKTSYTVLNSQQILVIAREFPNIDQLFVLLAFQTFETDCR